MNIIKLTYWDKIFGNKFSCKLSREMLSDDGCVVARTTILRGESLKNYNPKVRFIHYDKKFVIEYLLVKVIEPLKLDREEFINLINEAFEKD